MEEFIRGNWLSIVVLIVQGLWAWLLWSLRKQFVSIETHSDCQDKKGKTLETLKGDVGKLGHRLDIVEREVKTLPDIKGINQLSLELAGLRGEMKGFRSDMAGQRELMKRTERQLSLLIEHELKGNRS